MKFELDLFNYATKGDLKYATGVDTTSFAKTIDLANLKPDVDKLEIDKLKNIPTNFSNLKSKVDKLDIDKVVPVPVDLILTRLGCFAIKCPGIDRKGRKSSHLISLEPVKP